MEIFQNATYAHQTLHHVQYALHTLRTSAFQIVRAALISFAASTIPSFQHLNEAYHTSTLLQHHQAVIPLPFTSRPFLEPWNIYNSQTGNIEDKPIQIFDSRFDKLITNESNNVVVLVEAKDGYAFAHEAPVYFSDKDELYFCSNAGGFNGRSNSTHNNAIFRINLTATLPRAKLGISSIEKDVYMLHIDNHNIQMTNGATPYQERLLVVNSGRTAQFPPSLTIVDRFNLSNVQVLLNNVAGRQFNSLNDVKINLHRGSIYFTDASYGFSQDFRPKVDLVKAIWRFDPITARLTMLDASLDTPNGIAISKDGQKVYITETGSFPGGNHPFRADIVPSAIYVFDVVYKPHTEILQNKRLFAHVPTGVADGINVDTLGNVYSCTGDGLYAWDVDGLLLMRVFLPNGGCASFTFAGKGRIIILGQSRIYLVQLATLVEGLALDTYPRADRRIPLLSL